jgi:hypothetical protein
VLPSGRDRVLLQDPRAAGLLSVVIFPLLGLSLLRKGPMTSRPSTAMPVLSAEDRAICTGR